MIETKHTIITEQLKQRIVDGHYAEKLPPLRTLMQEFNVSMQTINKAVKPLSASGFISSGPRGSIINYHGGKRPKYYAIGALCKRIIVNRETQELLNRMTDRLQYENYNTIFLDQNNERLKRDPDFWKTCPIDILIFAYQTLTPELAWAVYRSGIIPLARHYAGDLPVHVSEYGTLDTIDSAVGQLAARGYRKIASQFFTRLPGYHEFVIRRWQEIRAKYGIDCPGYENPFYYSEQPLLPGCALPEVILSWHTECTGMLEQVATVGLADKIKIVSYAPVKSGNHYDNFIPLNPPSDELYWQMTNDLLKRIAKAKPLEFLHCVVPFEAVFTHGIPPKN